MSEIKLKDEPIFVIASLCLFYPIGILFLLRSKIKTKVKWIIAIAGLLVFSSLLSLAFLHQSQQIDPAKFQLTVTRKELSVGQSGGLIVSSGEQYYTDYIITTSNDILKINGSTYTAIKPGSCTVTANFAEETRNVEITVNNEKYTDSIVSITLGGERYHLTSAKHVGKNAIQVTEEDALQSGKTPCKTCYK